MVNAKIKRANNIFITPGVQELYCNKEIEYTDDFIKLHDKIFNGDYGSLKYKEDIELNNKHLERAAGTVLGCYELKNNKVYGIIDYYKNKTVLTILLPKEY